MKISLNWLREFVNIPKDIDAQKLAMLFTIRTAEVEGVENQGEAFDKIVVGQIQEIHPHPDADKLRITKTSVGKETLQIVCGGSNLFEGQYVAVAMLGAKVKWHGEGEPIVMQEAKIRGVESYGMICAGEEIGVPQPEGGGDRAILDLSPLKPEIGMNLAELFEKNDIILTVDNKSLTHRPDLWGHYGIAREVAAITDEKLKPYKTDVKFSSLGADAILSKNGPSKGEAFDVEVKDPDLCPRYIGIRIEGIRIEPSPVWMQRRLETIGYRPINNIVDATNYVMAELGQPMHAFDAAKLEKGIVVRKAKDGETLKTLDGIERKLSKDMLVIADHKKPVAIAGVMGGDNSEIDENTTKILLEAATFHPSSVRKTSVKLGLRTEAVQRFEKSLDPNLAQTAAHKAVELILQICPDAKITGPATDIKNFDDKKTAVQVNLNRVFSKIGATIPLKKVMEMLEKLEFKVSELPENRIKVEVPTFRATKDISIEDDLVEEIARLYGYENIEAILPELPIKLPIENTERAKKHFARQILAQGMGFNEVYNYSFYSLNDIRKSLLPEEPHIKVQNYLSEDQTHLRISLVPNMLKNVANNVKHSSEFKIFEIGRTYEDLQEYFPKEEKKICAVIVHNKKSKDEIFYEAKGALEAFLNVFKIPGLEMRKGESLCTYAHPNRYAGYYLKKNGDEIARVFEIHPLVAKNYDIDKYKIAAFEINFTKLMDAGAKETKYKPIPKFPGITFDVSILIDKNREIGQLQKSIQNTDKQLIKSVKLFDIYEGSNIPADKKALAFSIHLQSDDRTLTDEESKKIQEKVFGELQKLGGEIRKG